MKFLASSKRNIFTSLIAGLLVCSFVLAPISHTFEIKKVEAGIDYDPYNTVVNALSMASNAVSAAANSAQAAFMGSLVAKEFSLDAIAWAMINLVIQEMIRSVTKWVNSGFQGSPAFVTDLGGFLLDIADKVAGDYIYGSGLSMLCSPFKLNIQLALDLQYRKSSGRGGFVSECRLSDVVGNMENFFDGNFQEGGWNGWYSMALTPSNNPYGAMLEAQSGLSASISNAQGEQIKLLEFGRGFKPLTDKLNKILTPGPVIEQQLNNALASPGHRLEVADEINELVGALFSQLVGEVFSGVGGLLGLTEPEYGSGDYFDRMSAQAAPMGTQVTSKQIFQNSIDTETKYLSLQQLIVSLITSASQYKAAHWGNLPCYSGGLPASLQSHLANASSAIPVSAEMIVKLQTFNNDYTKLTSDQTSSAERATLRVKYDAQTTPEATQNLMDQYMTYKNSGELHTIDQNVQLELQTIGHSAQTPGSIRQIIQNWEESIDTACRIYQQTHNNSTNNSFNSFGI